MTDDLDVVIIGAGPAGAAAAAMLADKGRTVEVIERVHFPRFSIGESLLPQSMAIIEAAGLMQHVHRGGFQFKDGAAFSRNDDLRSIYFPDKSTAGWGTTFQVRRDRFDQLLAEGAVEKGARIVFGEEVISFKGGDASVEVVARNEAGEERTIKARFALDASGFGRVLSRMLDLETPSDFPSRRSLFCHVRDNISDPEFDRNKILISVHPENNQVWYWLIPLADGLSSVGVVGPAEVLAAAGETDHDRLWALVSKAAYMSELLAASEQVRPAGTIIGYACNVKSLVGPGYALLGNAAEFLDPVFSSGVTIALKSASLAVELVDRVLDGETVDWQGDFVEELYRGIDTFRACVSGWYDGSLQTIIFKRPEHLTDVGRHLTSVLAGYAWDKNNPLVREPSRYLNLVAQLCDR